MPRQNHPTSPRRPRNRRQHLSSRRQPTSRRPLRKSRPPARPVCRSSIRLNPPPLRPRRATSRPHPVTVRSPTRNRRLPNCRPGSRRPRPAAAKYHHARRREKQTTGSPARQGRIGMRGDRTNISRVRGGGGATAPWRAARHLRQFCPLPAERALPCAIIACAGRATRQSTAAFGPGSMMAARDVIAPGVGVIFIEAKRYRLL